MSSESVDAGALGAETRRMAEGVFQRLYRETSAGPSVSQEPSWATGFEVIPPDVTRVLGSMADTATRFLEAGATAMTGAAASRGMPIVTMAARAGETATALVFAHTRGTAGMRPRLVATPLVGDDGILLEAAVERTRVRAGSDVPSAVLRVRVPTGTPVGRYRGLVATAGTSDSGIAVTLDVEA